MGLWGSKQQKEINIKNPEPSGQVFVSENALDNVIKSMDSAKSNGKKQQTQNAAQQSDLQLLPDLYDKRILEYEKQLLTNFDKASKEVENMFKERYQTVPVCYDLQKDVSACYTTNKNQPLQCLDIANQFMKCVEKERQNRFGLTALNP